MSKDQPLVLHIAPTPFFADRGCHIRIEGIAKSLKTLGYSNLVCTYHHGRDVEGVETSRIAPIENYTQTAAGPSRYKPWADLKLLWVVIKAIHQRQPVVIHAHLHEGLAIGLVAKILFFWKRIPLVADMQGSLSGELKEHGAFEKRPWLRWPVRTIEKLLMAFAKTIVCSSEHSISMFKQEFGLNSKRLSLVQDGATRPSLIDEVKKQKLKAELNIPLDKVVVVYSGALLKGKGLGELKELIRGVDDKDHIHFLIIGYPSEYLDLWLHENHLLNCTLTGQLPFEQLPDYLQIADIAIDPKANDAGEGSGKMLNYIACGLPVLAFDTQNNRQFVGSNNPLAANTAALITQLDDWSNDRAMRHSIGKQNLTHFTQHYDWQATATQLKQVYARLIIKR